MNREQTGCMPKRGRGLAAWVPHGPAMRARSHADEAPA